MLRHATAHGALSATKVKEWGLRPTFDRLVPELGVVAAAAIERLVQNAGYQDIAGKNRSHGGERKALSLRQPHAEAVMRGVKIVEKRSQPTEVRGRIYIYASYSRLEAAEEAKLMIEYGIDDRSCDELVRGVILGTVELTNCTGTKGNYKWNLKNPDRLRRLKTPAHTLRSTWFTPF